MRTKAYVRPHLRLKVSSTEDSKVFYKFDLQCLTTPREVGQYYYPHLTDGELRHWKEWLAQGQPLWNQLRRLAYRVSIHSILLPLPRAFKLKSALGNKMKSVRTTHSVNQTNSINPQALPEGLLFIYHNMRNIRETLFLKVLCQCMFWTENFILNIKGIIFFCFFCKESSLYPNRWRTNYITLISQSSLLSNSHS